MTPPDLDRFTAVMQSLCAAFRQQPDESLLDAYWVSLQPFPLRDIENAMRRAVDECEYFPRAVELRRILGHLSPQMRAAKSWAAVLNAVGPVGSYQSVDFDDPVTNAAVRMTGGWLRLCRMAERDLDFARADYQRVYAMALAAPPRPEDCQHLPGVAELENLANGHEVAPPVRLVVGLPPVHPSPVQALPKRTATLIPIKRLEG